MSTYAIGDVQGCFDELQALLHEIHFNPKQDRLWFTGDLVNRGKKSLEVLRFVMGLEEPIVVLGNHDMHLLGLAKTNTEVANNHTLDSIFEAPDREQIFDWVRNLPLLHYDTDLGFVMTHAGLPPQWDLPLARRLANEVETQLRGGDYVNLLTHMYGDEPNLWDEQLTGWDRARLIVNCLTRMRFCEADGRLELTSKAPPQQHPPGCMPWFEVPNRKTKDIKIIFGHWAALDASVNDPNLFALDTGCCWGGRLTALRLEDGKRFCVNCRGRT